MVKASDEIFKNLIESINDIVNDEAMNEARGRTANSVRFVNDKAPLLKLSKLRELAGELYHSPKKAEKDMKGPPLGIPDIQSFLAKNGFSSNRSKIVVQLLEKKINELYNVFQAFKSDVESLPEDDNEWSKYLDTDKMPSEEEIAGTNTENDDLNDLDLEDDDDFEA